MKRRNASTEARWRVQVFRRDGSIGTTETFRDVPRIDGLKDSGGHAARNFFQTVALGPGERAEYQVSKAGDSTFHTFGWRNGASEGT